MTNVVDTVMCPSCGADIKAARHCQDRQCPYCGRFEPDDLVVCDGCGLGLDLGESISPTPMTPEVMAAAIADPETGLDATRAFEQAFAQPAGPPPMVARMLGQLINR